MLVECAIQTRMYGYIILIILPSFDTLVNLVSGHQLLNYGDFPKLYT